jgi:hypothetical protein
VVPISYSPASAPRSKSSAAILALRQQMGGRCPSVVIPRHVILPNAAIWRTSGRSLVARRYSRCWGRRKRKRATAVQALLKKTHV